MAGHHHQDDPKRSFCVGRRGIQAPSRFRTSDDLLQVLARRRTIPHHWLAPLTASRRSTAASSLVMRFMCAVSQDGFAYANDSSFLSRLCFPSNSSLDMASPVGLVRDGRQALDYCVPLHMRSGQQSEETDASQYNAKRRDGRDQQEAQQGSLSTSLRSMRRRFCDDELANALDRL